MAPVDSSLGEFLLGLAIGAVALPYGAHRWRLVSRSRGSYLGEGDPFKNEGFIYWRNIFGAVFLIVAGSAGLLVSGLAAVRVLA